MFGLDRLSGAHKQLCRFLLLLMLANCSVLVSAADIPFFMEFRTANELLHYPAREDRKLNWDDDYRIRFGIDRLSMGDFDTSLSLKSSDNFIKQQVLLDHADLSYTYLNNRFSISSCDLGYGSGYRTNNVYHNDPQFNEPLYKSFRFNGFSYMHIHKTRRLGMSFGAMDFDSGVLSFEAASTRERERLSINTGVKTEFRIKDSFHSRPLALYDLNLSLTSQVVSLKTEGVVSQYIRHGDQKSMVNFFQTAEFSLKPKDHTEFYLSNQFESRAVFPLRRQDYKTGLVQTAGRLIINPEYEYQILDQDILQRFSLLLSYQVHKNVRIACYYRHTDIQDSESSNLYGIQTGIHRSF